MDNYFGVGKNIFNKIPKGKPPFWGALLLSEFKNSMIQEPYEIIELKNIIQTKDWKKAHNQFSKIRNLSLINRDKQFEIYLQLAENIAKITYNETSETAPFDLNSGYSIYGLANRYAVLLKSKEKLKRINGILNLFNEKHHDKNFYALKANNNGKELINKIFNSNENEMFELKQDFPENCKEEEIKLQNVRFIIHTKKENIPLGSLEVQYDVKYDNSKIGYYSFLWDSDLSIIDDFLVIN